MFTLQRKEMSQSLGISPKVLLAKLHVLSVCLPYAIDMYMYIYNNIHNPFCFGLGKTSL